MPMIQVKRADAGQTYDTMVGVSRAARRTFRRIDRVARLDIPVLVTGESGTGKELVARSIHHRSDRSGGPFVPVNTGAISPDLIASELFGHEKGSFTGADSRGRGHFENASGGTLFLDEITTMNARTQVSLLRVLETMEYRRVGGSELSRADVRVIAATNQNLQQCIRDGSFREDLYHRLNVFNVRLPPLRKRKEDIPLLVAHFARVYADRFGKPLQEIDPAVIRLLRDFSWPGNIRELENVIANSLVMVQGSILTVEHLPPDFRMPAVSRGKISMELGLTLEEAENVYILETLRSLNGNKTMAADSLGISRKSLYNKLKRYGDHH